jgi:hypothetical protein
MDIPRWRTQIDRSTVRIPTVIAALFLAMVFAVGCTRTSEPSPASAHQTSAEVKPSGQQPSPPHTKPVDAAAAVELARQFVSLYGTLSPANPAPGQTWLASWRQLATDNVVDDATANFDKIWNWTWEQQVQCHDVMVNGNIDVRTTDFGTVVLHIPAKRYVLGLTARANEGIWQDLSFDVTVGPRNAQSTTDPRIAVYLVTMTVVKQG